MEKTLRGNVILDVGKAFSYDKFKELYDVSNYKILYIGEDYFIKDIKAHVASDKVEYWSYEQLYTYDGYTLSEEEKLKLTEVVSYVVNDKLTVELFDRTKSHYFFNYSTRNDVELIQMTIAAYRYVQAYQPSFMLLYECSHNIRSWVVARVCEWHGIPVRYCREFVFLWRNVLMEGMNRHPKLLADETTSSPSTEWERQMFLEVESRYSRGAEAIMPEYKEVMKARKMKKLYSLWQDVKRNWRRPYKVLYNNICYRAYERHCTTALPEKFIVFFLHLQPERTTLPEGYGFTQQYKAIALLNELIPSDWRVVVKEHPATFYSYCIPMGRWPGYYKALAALKKVVMVPLETDTYALMEQSQAVATVAGTVNREGQMMGKPVIMFGLDFYFGEKPDGIHFYQDDASLKAFIDQMGSMDAEHIKQSFHDYVLREVLTTGVCGMQEGEEYHSTGPVVGKWIRASRLKLLEQVLSK